MARRIGFAGRSRRRLRYGPRRQGRYARRRYGRRRYGRRYFTRRPMRRFRRMVIGRRM